MKRIFWLLPISLLRITDAYGACPALDACHGSSLNITDCCAVCDGSTDDTIAINNALDAVGHDAGGGEVIIPPKTCIISPAGGPNVAPNTYLHLYSNMTIRGAGAKSVLKIREPTDQTQWLADYYTVFSVAPAVSSLVNVVIKDFRVDQSYLRGQTRFDIRANALNCNCEQHVIVSEIVPTTGITVSGMFFDPTVAVSTINLANTGGDLQATITNNYFNFLLGPTTEHFPNVPTAYYDNSTVYLEGSQQVVTGNTFVTTLDQFAIGAIETHGGRSTIANNTTNNYAVLVNVADTLHGYTQLPNDIVVANNSLTCAQNGITLWPVTQNLRNVSVTGNAIHICNMQRGVGSSVVTRTGALSAVGPTYFGIATSQNTGILQNVVIANNTILHEPEVLDSRDYTGQWEGNTAGILVMLPGNISNVVIRGNVIKDAPISGIRIAAQPPADSTSAVTSRVRVLDNIIVDAGRNHYHNLDSDPLAIYRGAIELFGVAWDVDIMGNMISDTKPGTSTYGKYSIYLQQAPLSANIRASQNTVGVSTDPGQGQLLSSQASYGLKDATNANDLLISQIQGSATALSVNFTSFSQYITTISNNTGLLTVESPHGPSGQQWAQWVVGQIVTFRFLCATSGTNCTVTFDSAYSTAPEGAGIGTLPIDNGKGRAITFQVEQWATDPGTNKFFELYRSPTGVPNP